MKVLFASTSKLAIPSIQRAQENGIDVIGIVTKEEKPSGRGRKPVPQPISQELGHLFPIYKVSDDLSLVETLRELDPDLVIAVSFGMLVKTEALRIPRYGWINLHFSLLPKYRGAAPVQRSILAGDQESGVTIFQLDEGMDTGPIFVSKKLSISGKDAGSVLTEMSQVGADLILDVTRMIAEGVKPKHQVGESSLAKKITNEETRISWIDSAESIERQIRAFAPKPGAWCIFRGTRLKVLAAQVAGDTSSGEGKVLDIDPLRIGTGSGSLIIVSLQEAGKKPLSSSEWSRGARIQLGEKFE